MKIDTKFLLFKLYCSWQTVTQAYTQIVYKLDRSLFLYSPFLCSFYHCCFAVFYLLLCFNVYRLYKALLNILDCVIHTYPVTANSVTIGASTGKEETLTDRVVFFSSRGRPPSSYTRNQLRQASIILQ
jgi:hypothetical protein